MSILKARQGFRTSLSQNPHNTMKLELEFFNTWLSSIDFKLSHLADMQLKLTQTPRPLSFETKKSRARKQIKPQAEEILIVFYPQTTKFAVN